MGEKVWMRRNNEWAEIEVPAWGEGESSFSDYLGKLGFVEEDRIGSDPSISCSILFMRKPDSEFPAKYFIVIERVNTYELICAYDFPSMWDLWRDAYAMQASSEMCFLSEVVVQIMEKGFRASHGHHHHGTCMDCSPEEHQRIREKSAQREKRADKWSS